jgi:hypothetical protein
MTALVLDSGAVTFLSGGSARAQLVARALLANDLWPATVPTAVMIESLQGQPGSDAKANRFLKTCTLDETITPATARRAAKLRTLAGHGSAVDALLVAKAEGGATVVTGDEGDLRALAAHADDVHIAAI